MLFGFSFELVSGPEAGAGCFLREWPVQHPSVPLRGLLGSVASATGVGISSFSLEFASSRSVLGAGMRGAAAGVPPVPVSPPEPVE